MITQNQFDTIGQLGIAERDNPHQICHLVEEVGELAKDIVDGDLKHAKQEALDILFSAWAMYKALGGTDNYAKRHAGKQIKKWKRNLTQRGYTAKI